MLRKILKNKRAQNTAEYAILISLVVAGIIAMQTYAQRALQARVRDASDYLTSQTGNEIGFTAQYEPYYLDSDYDITRDDTETERLDVNLLRKEMDSTRTRAKDGFQKSLYNANKAVAGEDFL
jgi:flagellar assembly factor FliW